jgi:hypothetical protein
LTVAFPFDHDEGKAFRPERPAILPGQRFAGGSGGLNSPGAGAAEPPWQPPAGISDKLINKVLSSTLAIRLHSKRDRLKGVGASSTSETRPEHPHALHPSLRRVWVRAHAAHRRCSSTARGRPAPPPVRKWFCMAHALTSRPADEQQTPPSLRNACRFRISTL